MEGERERERGRERRKAGNGVGVEVREVGKKEKGESTRKLKPKFFSYGLMEGRDREKRSFRRQ